MTRAEETGFQGRVVHTSYFRKTLDSIGPEGAAALGRIVVVGGGKSAQDVCAYFARRSIPVTMVFERADAFISTSKPLPEFIRKSRFLGMLSPHIHLRTALEYVEETLLLSIILSRLLHSITYYSYNSTNVPTQTLPPHHLPRQQARAPHLERHRAILVRRPGLPRLLSHPQRHVHLLEHPHKR